MSPGYECKVRRAEGGVVDLFNYLQIELVVAFVRGYFAGVT